MTDTQLRQVVIDSALEVARQANRPSATDYEIQFSIGTLNRIGREHRLRAASQSEVVRDLSRLIDLEDSLL